MSKAGVPKARNYSAIVNSFNSVDLKRSFNYSAPRSCGIHAVHIYVCVYTPRSVPLSSFLAGDYPAYFFAPAPPTPLAPLGALASSQGGSHRRAQEDADRDSARSVVESGWAAASATKRATRSSAPCASFLPENSSGAALSSEPWENSCRNEAVVHPCCSAQCRLALSRDSGLVSRLCLTTTFM